MQFEPFEPGIDVSGAAVRSVVDGFKNFTVVAAQFLLAQGIGTANADGTVTLKDEEWYPQAAWLRAFRQISEVIGERVLFDIGMAIPRTALVPPNVTDVVSVVRGIDVAYHMNHRKGGEAMFNPSTGEMREGIGHYGCKVEGPRKIVSVCETPYPCAFDRGLVTAFALRFATGVKVVHQDGTPCRAKGGHSCTYEVTW